MKKITLLMFFCCLQAILFAQKSQISQETSGEIPKIKCYTSEYMDGLRKKNPKIQTEKQFEDFMSAEIARQKTARGTGVQPLAGPFIINVIVHIVHSGEPVGTYPNLVQAQVASQIRVLNEDFGRTNADTVNTPVVFRSVAGSFRGTNAIIFQLAKVDPAGNILQEAGVHRVFGGQNTYQTTYIDANIKPVTSWDPTRYLNVWTVPSPRAGTSDLYGYAQFPNGSGLTGTGANNGASDTDGLVMAADAFGSNYDANGALLPSGQRYRFSTGADKGRTATHELGHGLGLFHIWGDSNCGTDYCDDTPIARTPNYTACGTGAGGHPKFTSCVGGEPEMFMNYMDYVLDGCMNIFTVDQVTRMITVMNVSPNRSTLTAATVGNCPVLGLTRASGAYPAALTTAAYFQSNLGTGGGVNNASTGASYTFLSTGTIPPGLTLNPATGAISGTPTSPGNYNFTIQVTGATGVSISGLITTTTTCASSVVAYTMVVTAGACAPISVAPIAGTLTNAIAGSNYSQTLVPSGGVSPYTFRLAAGTLPIGLELSLGGVISGIAPFPQTATTFTVIISGGNSCGIFVTYSLAAVTPVCVPATIISAFPYVETFDLVTALPYTDPIPAANVATSTFPTNTNMACGWVVNNVNNDNRSWFNCSGLSSSPNNSAVYSYSTPNAANDWLISPGFALNKGQTYNISFKYAVGSDGARTYPETFEVRWGNAQTGAGLATAPQILPTTVATNTTYLTANTIAISPTISDTYYIGIRIFSGLNEYYLSIDDFTVTAAPVTCPTSLTITPSSGALNAGIVGANYTTPTLIASTGGTTATGLPPGLSINNGGIISGIPTVTGNFNVTVTAAIGTCATTAVGTYTLSVTCPTVTISPANAAVLPPASGGQFYTTNITQTGATSPVFSTTGLPAGLNINASTGVISGTTLIEGVATIVVTVAQNACITTSNYTLTVLRNPTTSVDNVLSSQVKVSPNPSKGDFNIDFGGLNLGKAVLRVYDAQGKQVMITSTSTNSVVISLEKLAKGMYLMQIDTQKGSISKRLIKK